VIRRPVVTEKSNIAREERNIVTLAVDPRANKRRSERTLSRRSSR
jgi:ribosomal protein L23